MTAEEITKHVNAMIDKTFQKLDRIYKKNREGGGSAQVIDGCRLIFPKYRNDEAQKADEIRISEQELRFTFVDVFHRYCDLEGLSWFYSIETPTKLRYKFSSSDTSETPTENDGEGGRSASFDFVIHDEHLNRICLIEFKALNPDPKEYHKDLEKLINDMPEKTDVARYFIQVLRSCNQKTLSNIETKLHGEKGKYKEYILNATPKIEYRYYVLEEKEDDEGNPRKTNL